MKKSFFKLLTALLLVGFYSCEETYVKPVKISYHQQQIDSTITPDAEIENFIQPYREKIDGEMKTVLSYTPSSMFKSDSKYNTAIGNMMADAVLAEANSIFNQKYQQNIDGVLLNYGGIRSGISQGDITVRTAYDVMPFENEIIVVELPYEAIQEMIRYLIDKRVAHPIAGMKIQLKHNFGLDSAFLNGEEIKLGDQKDKTYYIATTDYSLQGGDEMFFFAKNKKVYQLDYKLRNLLIDYFGKQEQIIAKPDERFMVKD